MKKKSYTSKKQVIDIKPISNVPVPSTPEGLVEEGSESSTDNAGRAGFSLTFHQSAEDIDGVLPYDPHSSYQDFKTRRPIDDFDELVGLLLDIGDTMDHHDEKLADFSDFLLKKYAEQRDADVTKMFNDIVIKIKESDAFDKDDLIIKITKRYSRYIKNYFEKSNDLYKSKQFAYNKILNDIGEDF
tara:strand:+ start:1151 stop:1708 length:558 start_codon:yes stop_codon:yes gene_type:complete